MAQQRERKNRGAYHTKVTRGTDEGKSAFPLYYQSFPTKEELDNIGRNLPDKTPLVDHCSSAIAAITRRQNHAEKTVAIRSRKGPVKVIKIA